MTANTEAGIHNVYERWLETIRAGDRDGLMALYADDATPETPLVPATFKD